MDEILTCDKVRLQEPTNTVEFLPVVKPEPKMPEKGKSYSSEPAMTFCLLQDENVKSRYIALKSANDRQIVATGFTRTLAYKMAKRKGFSSCVVISNYRE